jgi:HlyD family secretion protein
VRDFPAEEIPAKELLMIRKVVVVVAVLAVGVGAAYAWHLRPDSALTDYKKVKISVGDILVTVSATGTLEPEEVVDVGAQVAGQIVAFGRDLDNSSQPINCGSRTEKDTLLATIDDALFQTRLEQAQAALKRAQADVLASQAKLSQADRDWRRAQRMRAAPGAISEQEFDQYCSNYESAQAGPAQTQAAVAQARASLHEAEKNLGYTRIVSPVKGVIIDRRVNVGQTVVASLNAPSLFLIAKDLSRMEIWASVNEVDFGYIKEHQKVRFTVPAYASKTFDGEVSQIRYNATMTSTVVTYTVVVSFDNSAFKLAPYLTANLRFEVDKHEKALKVPNSVLRWRPRREQIREDYRTDFDEFMTQLAAETDASPKVLLWKLVGVFLVPIHVTTGLTDGTHTEIITDQLCEGDEVISGQNRDGREHDGAVRSGVGYRAGARLFLHRHGPVPLADRALPARHDRVRGCRGHRGGHLRLLPRLEGIPARPHRGAAT